MNHLTTHIRLTPLRAVLALLAALVLAYVAAQLVSLSGVSGPLLPVLGTVGSLATADAILKDLYRGPIIEQLNYKTFLLDMIERDSDHIDFTGRRAVVPVEATGNESPASMGDGGTLADPQIDTEIDAIILIRYHDGGLELSDQLIKQASGNNAGAFVSKLDRSSKKLADSMRKNINRQAFGTGDGVITTLTSSPAAVTTFTVASTQYLRVNQKIDVRNTATGAAGATAVGRTITAINRTTKTITVDSAITATTGDGVYKEGSRLLESDGLRNITATNRTLHSIDSTVNTVWNGNEFDAENAVAGEGLFEDLVEEVGESGQGEVEAFLTTRGVRKRLARTYQSQRRWNDAKTTEINGGYSAIFISAGNAGKVPV
ncbi:MAG: phage major capsid protein, partial [Actinophytocola sp.]|uniref:phage major capsid protein n=1 Tax=Actinophytocola sp. TaxID=1872138 RepID=UPI003D6B48E4